MPYFLDPNLEDEESQQGGAAPGVQISGASSTTDSEGSDDTNVSSDKKGISTGSGFQNLDSYLNTNQSKEFGQQVLGKVEGEIEGARENQSKAAGQFKDQVQGSNRLADMGAVNSAIANPTGANKDEFQGWLSQSYQGPKSLAESPDTWNQYWSGSNKAGTSAKLLGTEPGRFALLDSYYGRPSYNFGEKSLDNLLVQQSGIGRETRGLQNQAAQLKSQGNDQALQLQDAASRRIGEVNSNRQQVRGAIGIDDRNGVVTDPNAAGYGAIGQLQNQVLSENDQRKEAYDALMKGLSSGGISSADAATLGINPSESLWGVDPTKYVDPHTSLANSYTPEERARYKALSELAGVQDSFSPSDGYSSSPYGLRQDEFKNAISNAQSSYKPALSSLIDTINSNPSKYWSLPNAWNADSISNPTAAWNMMNSMKDYYQNQAQKPGIQDVTRQSFERQAQQVQNNLDVMGQFFNKYGIDLSTGQSKGLSTIDNYIKGNAGNSGIGIPRMPMGIS